MSVKVGDRTEGKLGILNEIRVLSEYTIKICKNEKVFPKSSRWIIAKPMVDECIKAMVCVRKANAIYVQTEEDYKTRRQYQIEAHASLHALLSLVDLSYNTFGIENDKINHWAELIVSALEKLKNWIKSDKERYKK